MPIYAFKPATSLSRLVQYKYMLDGLFAAVFQYAFIAAFPIIGMIVVTKWVVDDWKKSKAS